MKVVRSIFKAFRLIGLIVVKHYLKANFKSHKNKNPLLHMGAKGDFFQIIIFVLQTLLIDK
ncbi:hypothetical protein [Bacillus fungorum]|uniref:hypothetical protein n=1 Tax=Bacillus fungorum TaxID=2039284 RepID=UPI003F55D2AE